MTSRANRKGAYEIPIDPKIADLFRGALRNLRLELRTHTVGKVKTYNPANQTAIIEVEILQVFKDLGTLPTALDPAPLQVQPAIKLFDIPVYFPRTSSGYVEFPVNPGDTGELHIQDRTLQKWLDIGIATDPLTSFTHALADSVFHPGLVFDKSSVKRPTDMTATVLDGTALVKIGANATEFGTLALSLQNYLVKLFGAAGVVPTDGGAAFKSNLVSLVAGGPGILPPTPPIGGLAVTSPVGAAAKKALVE